MLGTGFLAGLIAKLAGLGAAAKVAVATTTAALTLTVAGVTVAVLPSGGGDSGPHVIQGLTAGAATVGDTATSTTSVETGLPAAGADSTVTTNTPSASTSVAAGAGDVVKPPAGPTGSPAAPLATPSLPVGGAGLPDVSALTQIPTQVLSCLAPVFDLVGSLPAVSPGQIGQIGPTIVGCVSQIVADLPLPFGLNACISEIMGFVSEMVGQLPGVPDVGGLNVAACIPAGLPVPGGLPFMGGGFPFGR